MLNLPDAKPAPKEHLMDELRRLHGENKPLNLSAAKRRFPELVKAVYAIQPFWGWKSAVEEAGLTYAHLNTELLDYCTCELCGHEAGILIGHLRKEHGLTPAEYRRDHPQAEIMCETVRAARFRAPRGIPHWEPLWSYEYALDRLKELHRQGFPMNFEWANHAEKGLAQYLWYTGHAWDDCLIAIGLQPESIRMTDKAIKLTRKDIIAGLRKRHREKLPLAHSRVMLEDLRLYNAARRSFGSYEAALIAAKLSPDDIRLKKRNSTPQTRAQLLEGLRQVAALPGTQRKAAALALREKYHNYVFSYLGNWSKAAHAAGVPADYIMVPVRYDAPLVIADLHDWKAQGGELSKSGLWTQNRSLYTGACKCFGSIAMAVSAAGLVMEIHPRKRRGRNTEGVGKTAGHLNSRRLDGGTESNSRQVPSPEVK